MLVLRQLQRFSQEAVCMCQGAWCQRQGVRRRELLAKGTTCTPHLWTSAVLLLLELSSCTYAACCSAVRAGHSMVSAPLTLFLTAAAGAQKREGWINQLVVPVWRLFLLENVLFSCCILCCLGSKLAWVLCSSAASKCGWPSLTSPSFTAC